jgi:hypothetical protein
LAKRFDHGRLRLHLLELVLLQLIVAVAVELVEGLGPGQCGLVGADDAVAVAVDVGLAPAHDVLAAALLCAGPLAAGLGAGRGQLAAGLLLCLLELLLAYCMYSWRLICWFWSWSICDHVWPLTSAVTTTGIMRVITM